MSLHIVNVLRCMQSNVCEKYLRTTSSEKRVVFVRCFALENNSYTTVLF